MRADSIRPPVGAVRHPPWGRNFPFDETEPGSESCVLEDQVWTHETLQSLVESERGIRSHGGDDHESHDGGPCGAPADGDVRPAPACRALGCPVAFGSVGRDRVLWWPEHAAESTDHPGGEP